MLASMRDIHGYYLQLVLRSVARKPWISALMVLAIGLGVGACITTLTVYHLLSGDPLPQKSSRIFYPQVDPETSAFVRRDPPDLMDYTSAVDLWKSGRADRQAVTTNSPLKILPTGAGTTAFDAPSLETTHDFFPMFDVPFQYGGPWSATDDTARAQVAVISKSLNERLFSGENSVGRMLPLAHGAVRIVGVLKHWRPAPMFFEVVAGRYSGGDTSGFYIKAPQVYLPFFTGMQLNMGRFQVFTCWKTPTNMVHLENQPCDWVSLWVQMDTAAKAQAYHRYLVDYSDQQRALGRFTHPTNVRLMDLMQWLAYNRVVPSDVRMQAILAWAFLVICLVNVAGLLLTKLLRRSSEYGVRRALGASRKTIFAQCLWEALVIGVLGGLLGLLLAMAGLWLVRQQPVAYADLAHLDARTFLLALLLSLAASLLAGVWPAWRASRTSPASMVKLQ